MGPLLHLLWCSGCLAVVNPVQLLKSFRENSAELGQALLIFIDIRLWEGTSRIMKDGTLSFPIVPHKDGALAHHLEVGPLPANFGFPSILGTFLGSDEELGRPREVVDIYEVGIMDFSCIIFQVRDNGDYPLGFDYTPYAVDLHIVPQIQGFILYV